MLKRLCCRGCTWRSLRNQCRSHSRKSTFIALHGGCIAHAALRQGRCNALCGKSVFWNCSDTGNRNRFGGRADGESTMTEDPLALPPDSIQTMPQLIRAAAAIYGDATALTLRGESIADDAISFRELDTKSAELARALIAMGLGKGSRVGFIQGNSPTFAVLFAAIARIGAIAIPISTLIRADRPAKPARPRSGRSPAGSPAGPRRNEGARSQAYRNTIPALDRIMGAGPSRQHPIDGSPARSRSKRQR